MACATTSSSSTAISLHSLSSSSSFPANHISPRVLPPHRPTTTSQRPLPTISAACATAERAPLQYSPPQTTSSLYELLGIHDGATCTEIKSAYRRLARSLHPDVVTSKSSNGGEFSTSSSSADEEFIRVHEAYATLYDPIKRADYDKMLMFKRRRFGGSDSSTNYYYSMGSSDNGTTSSYARFSGYTRRTCNWETDQCW